MAGESRARGTLFYSWQADSPNSTNRSFIQTALERAARTLAQDESLRVEPVIDRDTSGVPGAPDIAATIFEKIEAALIFVADVSIINTGSGGRPTPNPNVLVELGYALRCLGPSRLVLVFNTATGTVEELPFDLRMKRVLTYHAPLESEDKATPRAGLERTLTSAIRTILEAEDLGDDDTPPPLPVNENTLFAYITGSRRVRNLDRRLAEMYGLPLDTTDGGYVWLPERLEYFGIKTIAELDEALKKHGEIAFYMGYSWRPQKEVHSGFILNLLTNVLAAQLPTDEEIEAYGQSLKYTSGGGWLDLRRQYQQALLYKEQTEQRSRRRWV